MLTCKRLVRLVVVIGTLFTAMEARAALYWTPWVSEENGGPPSVCNTWNEGAAGFGCSGRYCDSVRLLCETLPYGDRLDPGTDYWTSFFSEESTNYRFCTNAGYLGILSGIRCSGSYCDNISLECTLPRKSNGLHASMTDCRWSSWYSEEQGSVSFGYNRYITGVQCSGSYCDNKRFYVCSLSP